MGMQENGGTFDPGGGLISVLTNLGRISQAVEDRGSRSRQAEDLALATKMEAEDRAREQREEAKQDAGEVREKRRRERSRALLSLGKSGVTLSGSPLAVLQGRGVEDEREYQSILNAGLDKADQTLSRGRSRAAVALARGRDQDSGQDWLHNGLGLAGSLIKTGPLLYGSFIGDR